MGQYDFLNNSNLVGLEIRGRFPNHPQLNTRFKIERNIGDWAFNITQNGVRVGSLNKAEFIDDLENGYWELVGAGDAQELFDELYESKLTKKIIKEAIGVSEDVKSLSEFLHGELSDHAERNKLEKDFFLGDITFDDYVKLKNKLDSEHKQKTGRKVYTPEQLPMLKNMNIIKLVVDSVKPKSSGDNAKSLGHFNAGKSRETPKGSIVYLKFYGEPEKSTIYHELTHVLQFSKIGRSKMAKGLKPYKKVVFSKGHVNKQLLEKEKEIIDYFVYYVYQAQEHEITAKVTETYSTIEERLRTSSFQTAKKGKDPALANALFKTVLEGTYGYKVADYMINYDIFEEFKKVDENIVIQFFSRLADVEKYVKMEHETWPRVKEIFKIIFRDIYLHRNPHKLKILSDDEIINMMKQYNDFINKQGYKLKRKLTKLYGHFF